MYHRPLGPIGGPPLLSLAMALITITSGDFTFTARFEEELAPLTTAWFKAQLPFSSSVVHARWSGEAVWIPLGDLESGLPLENHTVHPSRGDFLFYPGGISETELLFPYGSAAFASKAGALAGNHFLTLASGHDRLPDFGNHVLYRGEQPISFASND